MKLYHFTSLESFTKIWVTKQLLFSESRNLNDCFEKQRYIDSSSPDGAMLYLYNPKALEKYYKVLAKYKQISFALDSEKEDGFKSPMMWGHYAHNENGVCIELDSEKLPSLKKAFMGKVIYDYNVPSIPFDERILLGESDIHSFIQEYQEKIFFIKHKHWEHENEYRIISNEMGSLSIADAITRIYVYNKSSVNTKVVRKLVNDEVDVLYLTVTPRHDGVHIGSMNLNYHDDFEKKFKGYKY